MNPLSLTARGCYCLIMKKDETNFNHQKIDESKYGAEIASLVKSKAGEFDGSVRLTDINGNVLKHYAFGAGTVAQHKAQELVEKENVEILVWFGRLVSHKYYLKASKTDPDSYIEN